MSARSSDLAHFGLLERALACHQQGRLNETEALCRQLLEQEPQQVQALYVLGVLALQDRRDEEAAELFARASALIEHPWYLSNLGEAERRLGRVPEAIAALSRALELEPTLAEASFNLGLCFQTQGQTTRALECFDRAAALRPNDANVLLELGGALVELQRYDDAVETLQRALELDHRLTGAHNQLGNALKRSGRADAAVLAYRRATELEPTAAEAHSNLVYTLAYDPSYDDAAILDEARRWQACHAASIARFTIHDNERSPDRRLRIGYVSADFRGHVQSLFTLPLLRNHDRLKFEIFCYSSVQGQDALTREHQGLAQGWRDIAPLDDRRAAELVREDKIDILVDLTMHMANHRLLLFARKPAPLQLSWLAYPGTTGLDAIDFRLSDPTIDPAERPAPAAERSLRLPDTFWCFDPWNEGIAVTALPALTHGHVTFGCLNNFSKTNPQVFDLWARVLAAVDHSRLILLAPRGRARERVRRPFEARGVASERLEFVDYRPRAEYLRTYQRIDLALDTFPYNGHTTSLDAWWMGVPVLTLVGPTIVGRAGLCYAHNLDLPESVAWSSDELVLSAQRWAGDLTKLSALRQTLRQRMEKSPLMDAPRFVRNIEDAYRQVWREWCGTSRD